MNVRFAVWQPLLQLCLKLTIRFLLLSYFYSYLSKYLPRCVTRAQVFLQGTVPALFTVNHFFSVPHFTISDQLDKCLLTPDSPKLRAHLPVTSLSFHPVVTVLLTTTHCHAFYTYPVAVAARSKAWVYGPLSAEIVGSDPTGFLDVCLL